MRGRLKTLLLWLGAGVAVCVTLIWLVIFSAVFASPRTSFFETILETAIGQPVRISGQADVDIWPSLKVSVTGLSAPGNTHVDVPLAALSRAELTFDWDKLLIGKVDFAQIHAKGLEVNLVSTTDGQKSWLTAPEKAQAPKTVPVIAIDHEIGEFLIKRDVTFLDFTLVIKDEDTGFEFIGDLESFEIEYTDPQTGSQAKGNGRFNGLPFAFEGAFGPQSGVAELQFGSVRVVNDTVLNDDGRGYKGALTIEVGALADLFELLKLDTEMAGTGTFKTDVKRAPGVFAFSNLTSRFDLTSGGNLELSGDIQDLKTLDGMDLQVQAELTAADINLPPISGVDNLALSSIRTHILGDDGNIELQDIEFEVNANEGQLEKFGPFSIGQIARQETNTLAVTDISLPLKTPHGTDLSIEGEILDLFNFQNYRFKAAGEVELADLLTKAPDRKIAPVAKVALDGEISDPAGRPALTHFHLTSFDDAHLHLDAQFSVEDLSRPFELGYTIDLGLMDLPTLARDLHMPSPKIDRLDITSTGAFEIGTWAITLESLLNDTKVALDLNGLNQSDGSTVRGAINSAVLDFGDYIRLAKFLEGLETASQKETAPEGEADAASDTPPSDAQTVEALPFVVPPGPDSLKIPGMPQIQPLVIGDIASASDGLLSYVSSQLSGSDLLLDVNIATIKGLPGLPKLTSDIRVTDGVLTLAPITASMADAHLTIEALVDLNNSPDKAQIKGQITGWTLQDLAEVAKLDIGMAGGISTYFDLTGPIGAPETFFDGAKGGATLRINKGRIDTSLLHLAGRGIVSWLFSQQMAQGYSSIDCLVAPLAFSNGVLSTRATTLDTSDTQLVITGQVNLIAETLSLRGEPRPLGMPFEPSPFPFSIAGTFQSPAFDLLKAIPRQSDKRLRLANRKPCVPDMSQAPNR